MGTGNALRWDAEPDDDGVLFGMTTDNMISVALMQCLPGFWVIDVADIHGAALAVGHLSDASVDDAKRGALRLVNLAARGLAE